jgi:hypothetical protein
MKTTNSMIIVYLCGQVFFVISMDEKGRPGCDFTKSVVILVLDFLRVSFGKEYDFLFCGSEYISWEDLSSAVCLDPADSYLLRYQPINKDTLDHWRALSNLWYNLPRSDLGLYSPCSYRSSIDSFQAGVSKVRSQSKYKIVRGLWNAHACSSVLIGASLMALYSALWKNADRMLGQLGKSVPWMFVSLAFLSLSMNFIMLWRQLMLGLEPKWAATENTDKEIRARVIDGVQWALKNRDCSNPHDKSFSLQGVLNICQVVQRTLDYARPVADAYRILMEDLISWDPQSLIMLLDAGSCISSAPSWVPDWERAVLASGLYPNIELVWHRLPHILGNTQDIDARKLELAT